MATINYVSGTAGMTTRGLANLSDVFEYRNPVQIAGGYRFDLFNVTANEVDGSIEFYGNLTLNGQGALSSGTVTGLKFTNPDNTYWQISCSLPAATLFIDGISAVLTGADAITGGDFRDNLWGHGGIDTLNGGAENDILVGGLGNDALNGGDGYDLLSYYDRTTAVTVTLANLGSGTVTIGTEVDTYTSMESLEGGAGNDRLTGNAGSNDIYGGAGHDLIKGMAGNDYLSGWDGNDKIYGGDGKDWLLGELGNDLLDGGAGSEDGASYFYAQSAVTVSLAIQGVAQNTLGDGTDTLVGMEWLEGSDFSDILTGNQMDNRFFGGTGSDTINGGDGVDVIFGEGDGDILNGGTGNDTLLGGDGNDTIDGGSDFDRAEYSDAGAAVTVDLNKQNIFQNTGGGGVDKLVNIEELFGSDFNDRLYGDANANWLSGWQGNDILNGRAGEDTLFGHSGNDSLTGGAGRDSFVFEVGQLGFDKITDLDFTGADKDVVEFYGLFTDLNDMLASGVQLTTGFRVTLEAGSNLLFAGRTAAEVALADFGFYA